MSERPSFFDDAFDIREYEDGASFRIGGLTVTPHATQHYVPAWAMRVTDPDGARLVYCGDGGPTDRLAAIGEGADLLVEEGSPEPLTVRPSATIAGNVSRSTETRRPAGICSMTSRRNT